jgi:argininosuccinate lyase
VGEVVRYAVEQDKELQELPLTDLKKFSQAFEEDVFEILTIEEVINRRVSTGGTATANVLKAIKEAQETLKLEAAEYKSDSQKDNVPS